MRTVAIIQARTGSTRLPAKVLKYLAGKTVLEHVVARVKAAPLVDEVVIATTTSPTDDPIVALAETCGVRWSRGSESDVLSRYFHAAREAQADMVVRITSDCPLLDPVVLSAMVGQFLERLGTDAEVDYLSNTLTRSYPRGLDAEVFTFAALTSAFQEATRAHEREHVTPYLYQHPERFRLAEVVNERDLSNHRWTLDTPEDWELIERIYAALGPQGDIFSTQAVLGLLEANPELLTINAHVEQKKLESTQ